MIAGRLPAMSPKSPNIVGAIPLDASQYWEVVLVQSSQELSEITSVVHQLWPWRLTWKIMYVVSVRLIRLTETPKSWAIGFKAGK